MIAAARRRDTALARPLPPQSARGRPRPAGAHARRCRDDLFKQPREGPGLARRLPTCPQSRRPSRASAAARGGEGRLPVGAARRARADRLPEAAALGAVPASIAARRASAPSSSPRCGLQGRRSEWRRPSRASATAAAAAVGRAVLRRLAGLCAARASPAPDGEADRRAVRQFLRHDASISPSNYLAAPLGLDGMPWRLLCFSQQLILQRFAASAPKAAIGAMPSGQCPSPRPAALRSGSMIVARLPRPGLAARGPLLRGARAAPARRRSSHRGRSLHWPPRPCRAPCSRRCPAPAGVQEA